MMRHVITVDFGSTFTKVVVVDVVEKKTILSDKVPSTVGTDATIALNQCFDKAASAIGKDAFEEAVKLASSSAAGGLRMSVIGLTESLSALAGKSAALGAGAKIIANYSGMLSEEDILRLEKSNTEIVLFSGGYEHGNMTMVRHNAEALAKSKLRVPIIYAGNSEMDKEVRLLMKSHRKQCYAVENMIPKIGTLNVEPVQEVIRNIFLERITNMKGLSNVKKVFHNSLVPTPAAVLQAGELLSEGTEKTKGVGPMMIFDIGGATTDVYSFNENRAADGSRMIGLPEPYGKRTVEGDLGMRESSGKVVNEERISCGAQILGVEEDTLRHSIEHRMEDISYLPADDDEMERGVDDLIAQMAVTVASVRHAGHLTPSYTKEQRMVQQGKNLEDIKKVIGTGGILVHNPDPAKILDKVEKDKNFYGKNALLPKEIEAYLDADYVLFAAGLLQEIDKEAALAIMLDSLKAV